MTESKWNRFFYFFSGVIIIMIPVLSNNYPFVYSDTGTYIVSGFDNFVPKDRPIFYGWFIRHLSLSLTFWIPVIFQCFFTFLTIHLIVKYYLKSTYKKAVAIIISMVLISCTGLGLFAGKLMPDIFTGLIIVSGFLLFFNSTLLLWEKISVSIIFYYGLLVHLSHIGIIILFLILLFLYYLKQTRFNLKEFLDAIKRKRLFISLSLLAIITVPTVNVIYYDKFQFSASNHVFTMARLAESGVLKRYLEKNCEENNYRLCAFKDEIPSSATAFIWPRESLLIKTGGWDSTKTEYKKIISDIYFSPEYWQWLTVDHIMATMRQFFTFSPGEIEPHTQKSVPFGCMNWKMPHELNAYMTSKQQTGEFNIEDIKRRQTVLVYFSLLFFLLILTGSIKTASNTFGLNGLLFITVFLFLNAFICGALANVIDRLQGRVIWILPLFVLVIVINWLGDNQMIKKNFKNEK